MKIRVCNWNTNYWQQRKSYQKTWDYICTELKPDILLLQEAIQPENIHYLKHSTWKPIGGTRDWGSGIWSRYPVTEIEFNNGYEGHVVAAEIQLPEKKITVINIHSPIEQGYSIVPLHRIFSDLTLILEGKTGKRDIILGGDFNAGKQWNERQEGRSHSILFERIENFGLMNCLEKVHDKPVQTYRHNIGNTPWQLDHMFISKSLEPSFIDCRVKDSEKIKEFSDHDPIQLSIELDFGIYDEMKLVALEDKLGTFFLNKSLLVSALTSKSYRKEASERGESLDLVDNERLAFLGDAVLELVTREQMYSSNDDLTGVLSAKVDTVVDNHSLYMDAIRLGLKSYLRLGSGESDDEKGEEKILSRGLESLVGALYLDQGLNVVEQMVQHFILKE